MMTKTSKGQTAPSTRPPGSAPAPGSSPGSNTASNTAVGVADGASAARKLTQQGHGAIIGLQWGDEGKGQIVDVLTENYDLVVRYNGGANAGHTVQIGDQKFALHLVPSGILNPKAVNVVANGVVVDPAAIRQEMTGLRERGVAVGANLKISDRAHVVLPYHKLQDKLMEKALGADRGGEQMIGTTGRGIGPCYADKAQRGTALRMGDLLTGEELHKKLGHIVSVKNVMLGALAQAVGEAFEPFDAAKLYAEFAEHGRTLREHICDTTELLHSAMEGGRRILFEGANACLLDVDHGTYPFVTSSNCSSLGIYAGAAMPGGKVGTIIGVVKVYTSRVGGGPMPTELKDDLGEQIRKTGNEYGTTTGRPRRCGWLDLLAVRYAAKISGITALACTGLSVLASLPKLKVCVGYRWQGQELKAFPADANVLAQVEPVYQEMEGFGGPVDQCRSQADLPAAARRYLKLIEEYTGVPVVIGCVGRRRDQILWR
ncbi:MAG: adenylosuccinate synthase [Phycisphaeraceae bacterium]|nr:adenylosuccinate synthase [Phycisphaeraceae bacterium]